MWRTLAVLSLLIAPVNHASAQWHEGVAWPSDEHFDGASEHLPLWGVYSAGWRTIHLWSNSTSEVRSNFYLNVRELRGYDCGMAISERTNAVAGAVLQTNFSFYRYDRQNLTAMKSWLHVAMPFGSEPASWYADADSFLPDDVIDLWITEHLYNELTTAGAGFQLEEPMGPEMIHAQPYDPLDTEQLYLGNEDGHLGDVLSRNNVPTNYHVYTPMRALAGSGIQYERVTTQMFRLNGGIGLITNTTKDIWGATHTLIGTNGQVVLALVTNEMILPGFTTAHYGWLSATQVLNEYTLPIRFACHTNVANTNAMQIYKWDGYGWDEAETQRVTIAARPAFVGIHGLGFMGYAVSCSAAEPSNAVAAGGEWGVEGGESSGSFSAATLSFDNSRPGWPHEFHLSEVCGEFLIETHGSLLQSCTWCDAVDPDGGPDDCPLCDTDTSECAPPDGPEVSYELYMIFDGETNLISSGDITLSVTNATIEELGLSCNGVEANPSRYNSYTKMWYVAPTSVSDSFCLPADINRRGLTGEPTSYGSATMRLDVVGDGQVYASGFMTNGSFAYVSTYVVAQRRSVSAACLRPPTTAPGVTALARLYLRPVSPAAAYHSGDTPATAEDGGIGYSLIDTNYVWDDEGMGVAITGAWLQGHAGTVPDNNTANRYLHRTNAVLVFEAETTPDGLLYLLESEQIPFDGATDWTRGWMVQGGFWILDYNRPGGFLYR